jgi:excinuclease ABC subunit B
MASASCCDDNRPLKFEEFETMQNQVIYVSRPIMNQKKLKVEVIRPTDLLDPVK